MVVWIGIAEINEKLFKSFRDSHLRTPYIVIFVPSQIIFSVHKEKYDKL